VIVALLLQSKQQSDGEQVALWNIPDIHGNTPLHAAVFKKNDVRLFSKKELLAKNLDIEHG
jgi:hypothetical protein